jgi:hypothetical protein
MRSNARRGAAIRTAMMSGMRKATVFGASSPTTTCRYVIARKANAVAMPWAAKMPQPTGTNENQGSMTCASAGSPTQPRARLVIVMPSWMAAIMSSSRRTAVSAAPAPSTLFATISSSRVRRKVTRENSAATKKAFTSTSSGMTAIRP